jgi:hypothetical protein
VIDFALTDRFLDGDPADNIHEGSGPDLFDPQRQDINRYHGGDLRGLERAIQTGYHGYRARDFLDHGHHSMIVGGVFRISER